MTRNFIHYSIFSKVINYAPTKIFLISGSEDGGEAVEYREPGPRSADRRQIRVVNLIELLTGLSQGRDDLTLHAFRIRLKTSLL